MRKFYQLNSTTHKNINNNTSINVKNQNFDKIGNIIKYRLFKKKNLIIKSIQKRKKIKDKYIPKNEIFYSQFASNSRQNKNIKKSNKKDKSEEEKNIPLRIKMLHFQKMMNKTNYLINNLKEENKIFHNGYFKELLSKQKNKKNIKLLEPNRVKQINDLHKNNVFNMSLLLTKNKRIPSYILESLDNNESKEDLKIIQNLKSNFVKGQHIQYPDFLYQNKDEKNELFKDIIKMKKENKLLEENISNYEKNLDSLYDFEIRKDQSKELTLFKKRLSFFQNNENNKILQLNLNDSIHAKSTKNIKKKFLLSSPENKGEYKLVTKCEVKDKLTPKQRQDLFESFSSKTKLKNVFHSHKKEKGFIAPTRKGKVTSDLMTYNQNISNLKIRNKKQTLRKKIFYKEKYFDSLSQCLESFTEQNSKEKDIIDLYSFMKKANLLDVRDLTNFYKKKYGKEYVAENVMKGVRRYIDQYNVVQRMYELDKLKYFIEDKNEKNRKTMIENIKELDEQIKNGGLKFTKRILDLN